MTKVPQGFDFSFLNEEEARKILQVLERNEELQRAEKDRISKLQKTKRDIRWLQGVTGEWFEEIQRKKFCNETDVSQMLKQPLKYRLRKEMAKNDPMELQTSRSKNQANQKNPTSVPSRPSFRASFASLFSFRKSRKETSKLLSLGQKGCDDCVEPSVTVKGTTSAKIVNSPLENQPVDRAFVPNPAVMREGGAIPPPWDISVLENEFFQVLDDLDSKLAQEQSASSLSTRIPLNCGPRTQFNHFYSSENTHGNISGKHKNRYNETSNMSIYDILRPGTPREGFKTFSPRTRTIYDMYRTREPRVLKEDYVQKNTFGSTSLCFDSRQRSASLATRHFTARSLHSPATTEKKGGFLPPCPQQSPKRTPLSSIIWNRSDSSRDGQNQGEFLGTLSPMEIDPTDEYIYPSCFQENRSYELYHSQNVCQSIGFNAPMDNAMSPDTFENSENMPFYHEDSPFARSFFSNSFGQRREQRFGQGPFWDQQAEHSSWSDFHQRRKLFSSSDRDFEMIFMEANAASAVHSHSAPSPPWGSLSPGSGTNVSRSQEGPHSWQSDFQMASLESMEITQGHGNQSTTHFGALDVCSKTDSSHHIKSGGLDYKQNVSKEPYSFGTTQIQASPFKTFFPQISDDKGNSQSPYFQNRTVTVQKMIPGKPVSLPKRSLVEVSITNHDSADSLLGSPANALVNNEKNMNDSISEDQQLNKMDQTNMMGEVSQPVSQTVSSDALPEFLNPVSRDSTKSDRFYFNAPTTVSSKRVPRIFSKKDTSKNYVSNTDKANELHKEKSCTGNRNLGSATSPPFIRESRVPPSLPNPNQVSHEDISNIIKNNHWSSGPVDNQNTQSPVEPVILDTEGEPRTTTDSTDDSRLAAEHSVSCDSLGLATGASPDSSPPSHSFPDALASPSTTVSSKRSPSDRDLSLGETEEKDSASKNQNNQLSVSSSENQRHNDGHGPVHDEVADAVKYSPFRNGKGKGKVRHHISCIEKLSKAESRSVPSNDNGSFTEKKQGNSRASELGTIYCTLPRKSASTLINSRQSESKMLATSIRNGPLPFQVRNNVADPKGKHTFSPLSPRSPESGGECAKMLSDSAAAAPGATERKTNMKTLRSASVRKGPLPFLIRRAVSCPSAEPCASPGRGEGRKSPVSDRSARAVSPGPWGRIVNPLDRGSSARDSFLTQRHLAKEYAHGCADAADGIPASRTSTFSLSKEDPLPFCSDVPGSEGGKTLHRLKTTSIFSVSGDEDHVKCLEVVSVYYTLPRKPSKKFCNLLQQFTQNADSLIDSPQVGTETSPSALEKDTLDYSTREQPGTPSGEDPNMPVSSAQNSHCLPHPTENVSVSQLPDRRPAEPTLQEMASTEANVSLRECTTREILPDKLAKTPLGDVQSRIERGGTLQNETLHTSVMLQGKRVTEEKSENCQESINTGDRDLSACSQYNIENSQARRSSGECAGSGVAITATGSGNCPEKEHTATAIDDSPTGSEPREVREIRTGNQNMTDKAPCESQGQAFAPTPALHKLQLAGDTHSDKTDLKSLQSKLRELPLEGQEDSITDCRKAEDALHKRDQPSLHGGNKKNKTDMDDLEKGGQRSSVKHRLAELSKANRNSPAQDLSHRSLVATIFPQSGSRPGFGCLSRSTSEHNRLFPDSSPKCTDSTGESRLSKAGLNEEKSENPVQVTVKVTSEPSTYPSDQRSTSISQVLQNEFKSISASPPKHEDSKAAAAARILEVESAVPAQLPFTSLRVTGCSTQQRRLSSPFPLEPAWKSTGSIPLASCQQRQRNLSSPETGTEPHLYRSKSLKSINVHGDKLCKSQPPKVRERHFSESTSVDDALSRLTLGNEFSVDNGYSRRFKSFSELPSCDENENWALYGDRTKTGPRSTTSISRPIDYGIFGKEQQLAFLENVKRSLTQGRLWKPSFLKNPGFLKDDVVNSPTPPDSLSSNSPRSQVPEGDLSPSKPLNIYEEDPVDSDCDTDTTTDDEYYLDENDKESEL